MTALLHRANKAYFRFAGTSADLPANEAYGGDFEGENQGGSFRIDQDAFGGGRASRGVLEDVECQEEDSSERAEATIAGWYREDLDSIHCEHGDGDGPHGLDLRGLCHPTADVRVTMVPFARFSDDDAIPAVAFLRCAECDKAVCAVVVDGIATVSDQCTAALDGESSAALLTQLPRRMPYLSAPGAFADAQSCRGCAGTCQRSNLTQ